MFLANPIVVLIDNTPTTPISTDLTEQLTSATVNIQKPQVGNQNTYGVLAQRRELKGLWSGTVTLAFHHDYATAGISQLLWRMLSENTPWTLHVTAHDAVVSSTNPMFVIPVALSELPVTEGDPGEIAASSVTLDVAGVPTLVIVPES